MAIPPGAAKDSRESRQAQQASNGMHLYYSIADRYPAYRSDLAELFAVELRRLGLHTEWFMASGEPPSAAAGVYAGQRVHLPPPRPGGSTGLAGKVGYWLADLREMASLARRPVDAIQCRDKYLASLAAIVVARCRGIPFFYWCSYPFPEHDAEQARRRTGWRRWIGRTKAAVRFFVLYRVICPLARQVFVQSARMKEDMHSYGIPSEKMTPVPMGVSARMSGWIKANPVRVVPLRIVYLGTLASVRRLDMLLDAFSLVRKIVPDAQLMLVGDGDHPGERQALERQAAELGLGTSVVFTGFVPMEQAWALSASAAVCVSPFYPTQVLASTSPTKLVEYLALGRPVVCNDHPEQSEIIRESRAGLCVEWSASAFAAAITELLMCPERAEEMASRGPAWVAANRTYPLIAARVWAKYCELLQPER